MLKTVKPFKIKFYGTISIRSVHNFFDSAYVFFSICFVYVSHKTTQTYHVNILYLYHVLLNFILLDGIPRGTPVDHKRAFVLGNKKHREFRCVTQYETNNLFRVLLLGILVF